MPLKGKRITEIEWPRALRMLDTIVRIDCAIDSVKEKLFIGWKKSRSSVSKMGVIIYHFIFHEDKKARRKRRKDQKRKNDLAALKKWQAELNQSEPN